MAGSNGIVIEFGDARLDFGRRVLERSGKVVAIRPKSLVLLCFLATNPNRVLSKEELIEAVWGDAAVTDDNLAQTIKDVRRAIGDRSASTLRSIPRRGYLFFLDHVASVPAASVAVLPFSIAGPGPSEHWLGDGLAEDILVELSRFQSLTVIARNSSFRFRGGSADVALVRRSLDVRYVVDGSVRKSEEGVWVTACLIETKTQSQLWAEHYDSNSTAPTDMQREIAQAIAATIEGRVAAREALTSRRKASSDWNAYDYFLRGRELADRYRILEAEQCFTHAIEFEGDYAHAFAWRSWTRVAKYWHDHRNETLQQAEDDAKRAVDIDDSNSWSHWAMGLVSLWRWQFDLAGLHYNRALAINPLDTRVAAEHASWLTKMGRAEEALLSLRAALQRDPYPAAWFREVESSALYQTRRYAEAIAVHRCIATRNSWMAGDLAAAYAQNDQPQEARREMAAYLAEHPTMTVSAKRVYEPIADPSSREHLLEGFRKAGMPET